MKFWIVLFFYTCLIFPCFAQNLDEQKNSPIKSSQENPVFISEIHANPNGKDEGKEWIELYNQSEEFINLQDWKIKSGKNEYTFKENFFLSPNNYSIVDSNIINKITIKNSENQIELINNNNQLIHSINYEKSKEGLSYANIQIIKQDQSKNLWMWTNPTKKFQNPIYYEIMGIVSQSPIINKEFFFKIKNSDGQNLTILFDNDQFSYEYLKNLLSKNQNLKILARKYKDEIYLLEEFQLQNPENTQTEQLQYQPQQTWIYFLLFPITLLLTLLIASTKRPQTEQLEIF
ncbi:lamin tail domain-containing protein [Patescibacteria group bacterium]